MTPNNLRHILMVQEGVQIMATEDHKYVKWIGPLRICNDGVGVRVASDPHQQRTTSYTPHLNADVDLYLVYPQQLRTALRPVVLGCLGRCTNLVTHATSWGVFADAGPTTKAGEVSYALGKLLHNQVSRSPRMVGDNRAHYCYEMFPGTAARVGNRRYHLITLAGKIVK